MRIVTYKSVIDRIACYMGESDGLDVEEASIANAKINFFVRLAWEHFWWPDLMAIEKRHFRAMYDSAAIYTFTDEVFYPATRQYYLALRSVVNAFPPATLSGSDYETDEANWIECQGEFSGPDYSSDEDHVRGNVVRFPDNGLNYVYLGDGVQITGAGTAAANTTYSRSSDVNGKASYTSVSGTQTVYWDLTYGWRILPGGGIEYQSTEDVDTPDLVQTWVAVGASLPLPTVATYATGPGNVKFWVQVPDFIRSLDFAQVGETPIGDVKAIWTSNPETNPKACRVGGGRGRDFILRNGFVQVLGTANEIWLEFRIRPNVYTGAIRSDDATYVSGDERYDTATGDYWIANQAVSAGESPASHPAKWDRVEFPYIFAEFVAQSAYAMMTNREQQTPENFTVQMAAGYPLLLAEMDKIERQQGQTRQLRVVTGRN